MSRVADIEQCTSIYKSSYLARLTGTRLVEAAFCQPAETYQRAATERRRRTFTLQQQQTDGQMILLQYITQTDGTVCHVQPITLDMDLV